MGTTDGYFQVISGLRRYRTLSTYTSRASKVNDPMQWSMQLMGSLRYDLIFCLV
jgi:hypothetical protein